MIMKKLLLGAGICALTLAGVGAAVALNLNSVNEACEVTAASADPMDYIYLDETNWTAGVGVQRYAAYFYNNTNHTQEWVNFVWDDAIKYCKVEIPNQDYEKVVLCRMNGAAEDNAWANRWKQTQDLDIHAGIYKPYSKEGAENEACDGSWEYILTVGENTSYMIPHGTAEVKSFVKANANDTVSLKSDKDTPAGTITPQNKASNNVTGDCHVKVGAPLEGTVDFYVSKEGWSMWASGYSAETAVIQDFCDALLGLGCSATNVQMSGLNWSGTGVKAAINAADVSLGEDKSYTDWGNVVNEAATRYVNLVSNGLDPIAGVELSPVKIASIGNQTVENETSIALIASACFVGVAAVGGAFFLLRRRKMN